MLHQQNSDIFKSFFNWIHLTLSKNKYSQMVGNSNDTKNKYYNTKIYFTNFSININKIYETFSYI